MKKKLLMLDSGAYSAWRKGKVIDIDKYIEFIKEFGHLFEICVNLDVIGDGKASYQNWMYLKRNGVHTMPVYHIGTDIKWLEKYLRKTDYIGLGAIANLSSVRRIKGLSEVWEKYLVDPVTKLATHKVHGMGLTAINIIERYPWYSVDSVSPILQAAYGGIYLPRIVPKGFDFLKLDMYKVSNKSNSHEVGAAASFINLGKTLKKRYINYFKELNIPFDGILPESKGTLMFGSPSKDEKKKEENTLATDHRIRVQLNLISWWGMNQKIPNKQRPLGEPLEKYKGERLLVYVGSAGYFKYVVRSKGNIGQLFSYFEINNKKDIENRILKYINNENK